MQDKDELDAELRRRIAVMTVPLTKNPEYRASVRPVFYEAVIWVAGAMLIWVVAVSLI